MAQEKVALNRPKSKLPFRKTLKNIYSEIIQMDLFTYLFVYLFIFFFARSHGTKVGPTKIFMPFN